MPTEAEDATEECSCVMFTKTGILFRMLTDPNCPLHGDNIEDKSDADRSRQ